MAATLKASKKGLEIIDRERKKRGWTAMAHVWYAAAHTSRSTLKRFREGKAISQDAFIHICKAVGIENWEEIVDNKTFEKVSSETLSYVLHLSDLHFGTIDNARIWYAQLAEDLRYELNCSRLDALILSGDIASRSTSDEYTAAKLFISRVCQEFQLESHQVVIVPGNHDVNWELAEEAYIVTNREDYEEELREGCYIIEESASIIKVRDEDKYKQRFTHFSQFYQEIKGEFYPLEYDQQYSLQHLPEQNLLILGLNSAWQIDHYYKSRANIHPDALSNVLSQIRRSSAYENCLKIAVWHHPLNSAFEDRIKDGSFIERLAVAGFRLVLQGGIHRAESSSYRYDYSTNGRQINIVGAGVFGVPTQELIPGYPWQYNLLKVESSQIIVQTRRREDSNGAWKPDTRWLQNAGLNPLPYYVIALEQDNLDAPELYIERGKAYIESGSYEEAIAYFQAALQSYTREVFPENWAEIQHNLGFAYRKRIQGGKLENVDQAIGCYKAALQVYTRESFPQEWVETQINLGNVYRERVLGDQAENLELAITSYEHALVAAKEIGDRSREAQSLGNVGNIFYSLGNYSKAIEYHQQSLVIAREIGNLNEEEHFLSNLGNAYQALGQYQVAIDCYQQQLIIVRQIGKRHSEAISLVNLGNVYQLLGQYQLATQYHQQALAVTKALEDIRNRDKVLCEIVQIFTQIGEFSQALTVAEGIENQYQRAEVIIYITQALLQRENYGQALATAQAIPDELKRLEALTKVVEVVSTLEGDRTEELLAPLQNDSDERVRQLVRQDIRVNATQVEQKKNIWKCAQTLIGHSDTVESVAVSPDGKVIASGSLDKTIKLWNLTTGQLLATLKGHSSVVLSLAFSPDGQILASASNMAVQDGNIKLWNVVTRTLQRTLGGRLLDLRVSCLAFSPDGETLATGHIDAAIRLWHLGSGKVQHTLRGHGWDVRSVTFSPDGQILISAGMDSAIKIWNWRTGKLLHTFNRPSPSDLIGSLVSWFDSSTGSIWSVSISPDGQTIASGGSDQPIMLWNASSGKLLRVLAEHLGSVLSVAFSPDGQTLASGSDDNTIKIWNFHTGELLQSLGHLSPVKSVAFSSNGQTLVSGSADSTIKVWASAHRKLILQSTATYYVSLSVLSQSFQVGGVTEVSIRLSHSESGDNKSYVLELPRDEAIGGELNIILNAPNFQFDGDNAASLPLDPSAGQVTQTAHFCLTALRPGTATITAELYRGDIFETNLEANVQVTGFEEAGLPATRISTQPRPVPQPDFILRVQTAWNETNSACRFQYQLRSFRFPSLFPGETTYYSESLSSRWIEQMRGLLGTTLENITDALPEDGRSHLTSLGQYLFQHLLPPELQTDFRSLIPRDRTFTLLILADQDASLPWELLHDGQRFLSDRFIIGRWFWELNDTRPHEFPVGAINVAHYADVEQPELWTALLEPPGSPLPLPLPEGVLSNLDSTEAMRGLHLIRYSQSSDATNRRNAPVTLDNTNNEQDIERQMRPAKLNFRRNRPLVSLGYVRRDRLWWCPPWGDRPELTTLEQTWASAFVRAGCSAFTGSLWAVDPAVEAAFISGFYNRLWTGDSLGEAFHASRQLARAVAPDSLDWLAYILFGDPMARPYRPVEGKGYAVVEPIGREIDDPLPPGISVRFRLSLRRTPPVWHEERVIEVAENLTFENLQAHVKTFGLQVTPDSVIAMSLAPTGNYLGWFTLVAPPEMAGNSALVQVFLMDGMQPIHSLMFSLNIENEGS